MNTAERIFRRFPDHTTIYDDRRKVVMMWEADKPGRSFIFETTHSKMNKRYEAVLRVQRHGVRVSLSDPFVVVYREETSRYSANRLQELSSASRLLLAELLAEDPMRADVRKVLDFANA